MCNESQMFKDNNIYSEERLWLNLISDNGAANQLLIGYFNEATDGFDLGYDTKRNLTSNSPAIIYTGINGYLDELPVSDVKKYCASLLTFLGTSSNSYIDVVTSTNQFTDEAEASLKEIIAETKAAFKKS